MPYSPRKSKMSRWWVAIIFFSMEFFQTTHAASPEDEVETLDMVEITGTAVPEKGRDILFPIPSLSSSATNPYHPDVPPANFWERPPITSQPRFLLDQTAHLRGFTTPVKPLKAEHPSYPRQAREHGWHGVVVVQVHINEQGLVESAKIKESSGHLLLDTQALQALQRWKFQPAKNGNFPVSALANVPIKFDLRS